MSLKRNTIEAYAAYRQAGRQAGGIVIELADWSDCRQTDSRSGESHIHRRILCLYPLLYQRLHSSPVFRLGLPQGLGQTHTRTYMHTHTHTTASYCLLLHVYPSVYLSCFKYVNFALKVPYCYMLSTWGPADFTDGSI